MIKMNVKKLLIVILKMGQIRAKAKDFLKFPMN